MTAAEEGLLLLTAQLEDGCPPLTPAQSAALRKKLRSTVCRDPDRPLCREDLCGLGCSEELADRILLLLSRSETLAGCRTLWQQAGVSALTRLDPAYPAPLLRALGDDAPPALFLRGDPALLSLPAVSLVGSRDLRPQNRAFAEAVGLLAAEFGFALCSGNARGADLAAQDACRSAGGTVLSFVADRLTDHPAAPRTLYLSEDGPFCGFTNARALRRNRCIHALGRTVFVAQSRDSVGGTWNGTVQNLRFGYAPVCVFDDGLAAPLVSLGADPVSMEQLRAVFSSLHESAFPPRGKTI